MVNYRIAALIYMHPEIIVSEFTKYGEGLSHLRWGC